MQYLYLLDTDFVFLLNNTVYSLRFRVSFLVSSHRKKRKHGMLGGLITIDGTGNLPQTLLEGSCGYTLPGVL